MPGQKFIGIPLLLWLSSLYMFKLFSGFPASFQAIQPFQLSVLQLGVYNAKIHATLLSIYPALTNLSSFEAIQPFQI
jgi:hypothetical protein